MAYARGFSLTIPVGIGTFLGDMARTASRVLDRVVSVAFDPTSTGGPGAGWPGFRTEHEIPIGDARLKPRQPTISLAGSSDPFWTPSATWGKIPRLS
jgi:hypothetical protein